MDQRNQWLAAAGVVIVGVVAVFLVRSWLDASYEVGRDIPEPSSVQPATDEVGRADRPSCSLNPSVLEELTGFEEVVESIDCVYHIGYIRPDENADAQCDQVLGYARDLEPDTAMVKIKDRSGKTHADCR